MAFEYIASSIAEELGQGEQRQNRRQLRYNQCPYDLPDTEFKKLYRLLPCLVTDIIDKLEPRLQGSRITAISTETKVFAVLRFYATGCFQRPDGEQWGISVSQSSISRSLHSVTDAINDCLFRPLVQFPVTTTARYMARGNFANARQPFLGAIGAIDCSHVAIRAPTEHEEAYLNHHGYQSINVQMICDANLKILNVNARFPGARHDAYIWNSCTARQVMERAYNRGERRTYIIGDSGYPLEPWLLTPLQHEAEGTPSFCYNSSLCSA